MKLLKVNIKNLLNISQVSRRNMSEKITEIITQEKGTTGIIKINRPKALNSINLEMIRYIYNALKKWENSMSLVIIKGEGDKSFCAGGDVRSVTESGLCDKSKNFFREEYTLNSFINNYKIPYISFMDGITMGGGVGLSVHGKYRIVTERTIFAMPETAIGLFPDVGGSYFLPRLQGKLGLFLGLTGFRLKGEDVLKCGIATHFCPNSKLLELENELVNVSKTEHIADILNNFSKVSDEEFILEKYMNQINKCFNESSVEKIVQNLKDDNSEWANKILETMGKMSPTSLKVTHRQINNGANLSLNECLIMEYRMVLRHLENSDFKEGVRALLIDKDQKPKWKPDKLENVTEDQVDRFFAPLEPSEELKLTRSENETKHKL